MKVKKEMVGAIVLTSLINILIFMIISIFTRQEESVPEPELEYIIRNERFYMGELKQFFAECAGRESVNYDCLHKKIKEGIPPNYYVHVRPYKREDGKAGWEFACIDTTKYGHEEELREALKARNDE